MQQQGHSPQIKLARHSSPHGPPERLAMVMPGAARTSTTPTRHHLPRRWWSARTTRWTAAAPHQMLQPQAPPMHIRTLIARTHRGRQGGSGSRGKGSGGSVLAGAAGDAGPPNADSPPWQCPICRLMCRILDVISIHFQDIK